MRPTIDPTDKHANVPYARRAANDTGEIYYNSNNYKRNKQRTVCRLFEGI